MPTSEVTTDSASRAVLVGHLARRFNLNELKQIAYHLNITLEELSGSTRSAKAHGLVDQLYREKRLDKLATHFVAHQLSNVDSLVEQIVVIEQARAILDPQPPIPPTIPDNRPKGNESPYLGMRYYHETDAGRFFGRKRLTDNLLARLPNPLDNDPNGNANFLPIIGASGSGKSSLVRAGLLPKLRTAGWEIRVIVPTDAPLKSLAKALSNNPLEQLKFIDSMAAGETRLLDMTAQAFHDAGKPLLLVVDQFEELFTTLPKRGDNNDDVAKARYDNAFAQRKTFIANLMMAAQGAPDGMTSVLITLRADFLNQCADFPLLWNAINDNTPALILAMQQDELREVISRPAEDLGYMVSDDLVTTILRDCGVMQPEDTSDKGVLPLLSHALDQMWVQSNSMTLTLAAYEAAGRVQGAIAQTADAVYDRLSEQEKVQAQRIFLQLTELGEGREDTRRRVPLNELRDKNDLLTHLADKRLIITDETHAQVTHEALIREWQQLRAWLDDNRDALRLQRRIAADAQEWIDHNRSPDFLYRGVPLDRALAWLENNASEAAIGEQQFVRTATKERANQQAAQQAVQQRELAATRRLAEANQEVAEKAQALIAAQKDIAQEATARAAWTRRWLGLATILLSIAIILGLVANNAKATSEADKQFAVDAQRTTVVEAQRAENEATGAAINLNAAKTAEAVAEERRAEAERERTVANEAQVAAEAAEAVAEERRVEAEKERVAANEAQVEAERLAKISLAQSLAALAPNVAGRIENDDELAVLLAVEAMRLNQQQAGSATWLMDNALRDIITSEYNNKILIGHNALVLSVALSPDGNTLASGSSDSSVRVWDLTQPLADPVVLTGHEDWVRSVAFSPDGSTLASGSDDSSVRVWDLTQPLADPVVLTGHEDWVLSVAFSPDGNALASGSDDRSVHLWDLTQPLADPVVLTGHEDWVLSVTFSPDGNTLASGSSDSSVRLWDLTQPLADPVVLTGHEDWVLSVAFSPDGNTLANGSDDSSVRLWDLTQPLADPIVLTGHEDWVRSVAFSPDGNTLASGSDDSSVRLWDLTQPFAAPVVLTGHEDWVRSVVFSPNGNTLASGSDDSSVRLWDLTQPFADPVVLTGHDAWVRSVAFSPDGDILASGSDDRSVRLWDLTQPLADPVVLTGHDAWILSVAFSPDGNTLASGSSDRSVQLWDLTQPLADPVILTGHDSGVLSVAFSPDGNTLASGSSDNSVRLWDLTQPLASPIVLTGHDAWVRSVAFSPDGNTLASGSYDRSVRLWDLTQPLTAPIVLAGHEDLVRSVAFSPDGNTLASSSGSTEGGGSSIRLWDLTQLLTDPIVLTRHDANVLSVAFSPNSNTLASGGSDSSIRLWDLTQPLADPVVLTGHDAGVLSVAFSPDGNTLASGSSDRNIRLWLPRLEQLADIGCASVRRNLTWAEWQRHLPTEAVYNQTCPTVPIHPSVPEEARR